MKNKEITMYELLGLMKDNKAPRQIKVRGKIFDYCGDDYNCIDNSAIWLISDSDVFDYVTEMLNEMVIILDEENDEFEDIPKSGPFRYEVMDNNDIEKINANFANYKNYIEQLIKNQKKIIERLKKDE